MRISEISTSIRSKVRNINSSLAITKQLIGAMASDIIFIVETGEGLYFMEFVGTAILVKKQVDLDT
ncbi:hypothetical protein GCM10028809_01860 [Spirosoma gilvum]